MMKKITSFLAMMLLFLSLPAMAQLDQLKNKKIILGEAVEELAISSNSETQWYVMKNGGRGAYIYSQGLGEKLWSVAIANAALEGEMATTKAGYLVRLVQAEDGVAGHYNLQTGLGDYFGELTWGNNNGTTKDPEYYFTIGNIGENADWWWLIGNNGTLALDCNDAGASVAGWGGATQCSDISGNAAWQLLAVDFEEVSAEDAALQSLSTVHSDYTTYTTDGETPFEVGTTPGLYGADAVAAFNKAYTDADAIIAAEGSGYTAAQIDAARQALEDAYQAVLASKVKYKVTSGYYAIISALDFSKTVTTEDTEGDDGEIIPGGEVTQHFQKAIYEKDGQAYWADFEKHAKYIFKIDPIAGTDNYTIVNQLNGLSVTSVGNPTTMEKTATPMAIDWRWNDVPVYSGLDESTATTVTSVNIRIASEAANAYRYIHANNHGGGTGTASNIVNWATGTGEDICASDWYLLAIDTNEALALIEEASPQKKLQAMIDEVNTIKNAYPDQKAIAEDNKVALDEENPLIKDVSQLSSAMTEPTEGALANLLDGNTSSFWHTQWSSSRNPGNGVDFIQVADIDAEAIAFKMTRRAAADDHVIQMSVYGFDADDLELGKEDGVLLAELAFPYKSNTETITSDVINTSGKNIIRFYSELTSSSASSRGYWHMSEFQLYPAEKSKGAETTQAVARASIMSELESALSAWNEGAYTSTSDEAALTSAYNAVKKAYEAWEAVYVDPAALREAIAAAPSEKLIKKGNNPGEWSGEAGSVASILSEAKAYDNAGAYTPAKSEEFISAIETASQNVFDKANKVKTGKWYKFRMPSDEECQANGWGNIVDPVTNDDEVETCPAIGGKYATVADAITNDDFTTIEPKNADEVTLGQKLRFLEDQEDDSNLFQFIAVADTAYMVQNKATGLYIRTTNGGAELSAMPSLFKVSPLGYGTNLMESVQIDTLYQHRNLHGQREGAVVCTWEANTVGSRSGWFIEEAGDVSAYEAPDFKENVYRGRTYPQCWALDVKLTDETATLYSVTANGGKLTLNPIKGGEVKAGTPFVMIPDLWDGDETYVPEAEDEGGDAYAGRYDNITFQIAGTTLASKPCTLGSLVGNYYGDKAPKGSLVASENTFAVVAVTAGQSIGANSAYVNAGLERGEDGWPTITIETSGTAVDGDKIVDVLSNVAKGGKIYTVDGKFVGVGNINTIQKMGRGIYVVNGVKIAVK